MPMGIARMKSRHVGATPRWTLSTRIVGENTRKNPISTSSTWVRKSVTASSTLSVVDSLTPRTLMTASTTITNAPATMSPGEWRSSSQNSPPT